MNDTGATPLAIAQARSTAARARLSDTMSQLQARLNPRMLAQDAATGLVEKGKSVAAEGMETARQNPAAVAGGAAALGLVLARRPLTRLLQRLWQSGDDATADTLTSLKPERRPTAEERTDQ